MAAGEGQSSVPFSLCSQLEGGYSLQFLENSSGCFLVLDGVITHIFSWIAPGCMTVLPPSCCVDLPQAGKAAHANGR